MGSVALKSFVNVPTELTSLSEAELVRATKSVVATETAATTNVVRHLVEIFKRRTFAVLSYSSMSKFAREELGYDKASAQRRVNAMFLAMDVPEVLEMIEAKTLHLQVAADIQTFLNKERGARRPYSNDEKFALVQRCARRSTRQVQRYLASLNPACDFRDSKRYVSKDRLQVTHTLSVEVEDKL
ncbi:MAG: hypothetical protein EOP05_08540, partial [Proteobacteria bacterium]